MRCCVFIDGGYLDKVLTHDFARVRIDYLRLSECVCEGDERLRSYYYHCPPFQSSPPTDAERERKRKYDQFKYSLLRLPRFEVREGKLVRRDGNLLQKRVDVLMAVDIVWLAHSGQIQKAILISGDNDLSPAIKTVKAEMILTELYYSPQAYSGELYELCDERKEITQDLIDKCKRL